jgi:3-phenylpropionate/trans-cinnamate dioxygenase ferredoxin subunit
MVDVTIDIADLPLGRSRIVEAAGKRFLICRSASGIHATTALCPHQIKCLEGARIISESLTCPHHGARFRLDTGASLTFQLTARALEIYPVSLDGSLATIALPD